MIRFCSPRLQSGGAGKAVMQAQRSSAGSDKAHNGLRARFRNGGYNAACPFSASSSMASSRKLTGRNPSLQEIMADLGSFIQPS